MPSDLPTLRARIEAAQALAAEAPAAPWGTGTYGRPMGAVQGSVEHVDGRVLAVEIEPYQSTPGEANPALRLMALAPDLVALAVDLLAEADRLRDTCLLMRESHQHVARQRDEARAKLAVPNGAAIRLTVTPATLRRAEALGWTPGDSDVLDWAMGLLAENDNRLR